MAISKKNTTRKTSSSSSSPSNLHPPYLQMISEAITTMKDLAGSSQPAIAKFIEANYSASLPTNFKKILSAQLKRFVKSGKLVKVKNLYKISPSEKVKKAANSVENKTEMKKSVKNVTAKTPVFQIQSGSFASSQSESPISASLELSSFSLNTNEENVGGASTKRSIGLKKAKLKRKNDEESQKFIETFNDENQQLLEILKSGCKDLGAQLKMGWGLCLAPPTRRDRIGQDGLFCHLQKDIRSTSTSSHVPYASFVRHEKRANIPED
ncbi:histone H1-like [Olea europaea subsp. europaea]|uniref:Histone H1-like n=1 Tax=Olea europaea subsp. europaea TaxID=158383 RepID=A0A8S0SE20_OLEEU|nr:histone H1-like [Olea europaea subsp. europaea]